MCRATASRHEIVNRLPPREARADRRRRHVSRSRLDEIDSGSVLDVQARCSARRIRGGQFGRARQRLVERGARACHHDEVRQIQDRRELAPQRDVGKCVGAHDEEQVRQRPSAGVQRAQGIGGVRRAFPDELHVGGTVPGPFLDRKRDEREAVERAGVRISRPVRRIVRRNEEHLVELERRARGFRRVEMSEVNGIERSAKHAQAPRAAHASRRSLAGEIRSTVFVFGDVERRRRGAHRRNFTPHGLHQRVNAFAGGAGNPVERHAPRLRMPLEARQAIRIVQRVDLVRRDDLRLRGNASRRTAAAPR